MEHTLVAPAPARRVTESHRAGQRVAMDELLVRLESVDA